MRKIGNNHAFIDAQNLYLGIRELGWKLDYRKFRIHLHEKYAIQKAFIFVGFSAPNRNYMIVSKELVLSLYSNQ